MAERCKYFDPTPVKKAKLPACSLLYEIKLVRKNVGGKNQFSFQGSSDCPLISLGLTTTDCFVNSNRQQISNGVNNQPRNQEVTSDHNDILKPSSPTILYG